MKLERCKNGHMYDASRYGATCPYCKSEGLEVEIKEDKIKYQHIMQLFYKKFVSKTR